MTPTRCLAAFSLLLLPLSSGCVTATMWNRIDLYELEKSEESVSPVVEIARAVRIESEKDPQVHVEVRCADGSLHHLAFDPRMPEEVVGHALWLSRVEEPFPKGEILPVRKGEGTSLDLVRLIGEAEGQALEYRGEPSGDFRIAGHLERALGYEQRLRWGVALGLGALTPLTLCADTLFLVPWLIYKIVRGQDGGGAAAG